MTFPREVKSIWTRKPSLVSLVYITQRYPNLIVYAFLTASNSFPYPNDTVSGALYAELVSLIYIQRYVQRRDQQPSVCVSSTCVQLQSILRLLSNTANNSVLLHGRFVSSPHPSPHLLTILPAFSTLRVWALHGKINIPVIITFLLSFFVPCINVVSDYARHCQCRARS